MSEQRVLRATMSHVVDFVDAALVALGPVFHMYFGFYFVMETSERLDLFCYYGCLLSQNFA